MSYSATHTFVAAGTYDFPLILGRQYAVRVSGDLGTNVALSIGDGTSFEAFEDSPFTAVTHLVFISAAPTLRAVLTGSTDGCTVSLTPVQT